MHQKRSIPKRNAHLHAEITVSINEPGLWRGAERRAGRYQVLYIDQRYVFSIDRDSIYRKIDIAA